MPLRTAVVVVLLLGSAVGLQAIRERSQPPAVSANLLYLRSPEAVKRLALSYDGLMADVYWIRAVQHYGGTKLSADPRKKYDLLYPLLDLTTSLDPYFNVAYQFGALFLAEQFPSGPGRPDQAIALLQRGIERTGRWEYMHDIGFVYYWWLKDYPKAAEWFERAAAVPGSRNGAVWTRPNFPKCRPGRSSSRVTSLRKR